MRKNHLLEYFKKRANERKIIANSGQEISELEEVQVHQLIVLSFLLLERSVIEKGEESKPLSYTQNLE